MPAKAPLWGNSKPTLPSHGISHRPPWPPQLPRGSASTDLYRLAPVLKPGQPPLLETSLGTSQDGL
eukprot:903693-Prymnesium_polylepis.1